MSSNKKKNTGQPCGYYYHCYLQNEVQCYFRNSCTDAKVQVQATAHVPELVCVTDDCALTSLSACSVSLMSPVECLFKQGGRERSAMDRTNVERSDED